MSLFNPNNKKNDKVKPVVKTLPVNEAVLEIKKTEFLNWLKDNKNRNK